MKKTNASRNKWIITVFIIAALAMAAFLIIRGMNPGVKPNNSAQTDALTTSVNGTEKEKYFFEYNGQEIKINAPVAPITEVIGEPIHFFEAQSCAFEGMDRVYTYSGFDLQTYTIDNKEFVFSVSFLDDTVATREGISIGASLEDVTKAYGSDFEKSFNQYNYIENESKLSFIIENDEVVSIEYALVIGD